MLPISAIAIYFTALYQFDLYDQATVELLLSQLGSIELVMVITLVQNCGMIFFACFFGYILASKLKLLKPLVFEKKTIVSFPAFFFAPMCLFANFIKIPFVGYVLSAVSDCLVYIIFLLIYRKKKYNYWMHNKG